MLAEFSIAPIGKDESLSKYVAEIIDLIDKSGLDYKLGAMGTTVEGNIDDVFQLIKACHFKMKEHSHRVVTHIAIDDRDGVVNQLENKPKSVETKLNRKIKR